MTVDREQKTAEVAAGGGRDPSEVAAHGTDEPGHKFVIAIDGPAASGKSSTATHVAGILGLYHVDSGALYRAITAACLRQHGESTEWTRPQLAEATGRCDLMPAEGLHFHATVDGQTADAELRSAEVTNNVSRVATVPEIRAWVDAKVRSVATRHDVVVDGRDIGTNVFPGAQLKIFLAADPWERARRRLRQRFRREPTDDETAVETEILLQRDARDATQSVQAKDAVMIDTTHLTQEEQVQRIVSLAQLRRGNPG